MSVLKYFKNTPGRPPIGRQALSVNFFFVQIRNEVTGKKKAMSAPQRATGACRPPLRKRFLPAWEKAFCSSEISNPMRILGKNLVEL